MSGTNPKQENQVDSEERQDFIADVYRVRIGQTGEQPKGWKDALNRVNRKLQKIFVDTFGVVADALGAVRGVLGGLIKGVKGTAELPGAWAKRIRNARGLADAAEDQAQAQIEDVRKELNPLPAPPPCELPALLAALHNRGVPVVAMQLKDGNWVIVVAKPEDVPTASEFGERAVALAQIFPSGASNPVERDRTTKLPLLGNISAAEVSTGSELAEIAADEPAPPPTAKAVKPKKPRKKK